MAIVKQVLFNDGEGLTFEDMNNVQEFLNAQINDLDIRGRAMASAFETSSSPAYAFTPGNQAAPYDDAADRTLTNLQGAVYQRIAGTVTGSTPTMLGYFLAADELSTQFADNASGQDRIDLVSIKLSQTNGDSESRDFKDASTGVLSSSSLNKRRNVLLEIDVAQGTPGTPPVEPSAPAGYVKWASCLVPDGIGANPLLPVNVRDHRMPIGFRQVVRAGAESTYNSGSSQYTAPSGNSHILADGAGARQAVSYLPAGGISRAIRVGMSSNIIAASGAATQLTRHRLNVVPSDTLLGTPIGIEAAAGTFDWQEYGILGSFGEPLWCNGYSNVYALERAGYPSTFGIPEMLGVRFTSGATHADSLVEVRWHLAG